MSELTLIQQQRETLHTFQQATAQRAKAEADADARHKIELEKAEAALQEAQQLAAKQLKETEEALKTVRGEINRAGVGQDFDQIDTTLLSMLPGTDPFEELNRCAAEASQVAELIDGCLWESREITIVPHEERYGKETKVYAFLPQDMTLAYVTIRVPGMMGTPYASIGEPIHASKGPDYEVSVRSARSGQEYARFEWKAAVTAMALSPGGKLFAFADETSHIDIRKVASPQHAIWSSRSSSGPVTNLAFSGNGAYLVTAAGNSILVWHTKRGRERFQFSSTADVTSIAFSPDSKLLASGDSDGRVTLWSIVPGWWKLRRMLCRLSVQTGPVQAIAFSPDGRLLAAGGGTSTTISVKLWDVTTRKEIRSFESPTQTVLDSMIENWDHRPYRAHVVVGCLVFSPDQSLLAFACHYRLELTDGYGGTSSARIRLWDVSSGQEIRTIREYGAVGLAFSLDGDALIRVLGWSGVRSWRLRVDENEVREIVGRITQSANSARFWCDSAKRYAEQQHQNKLAEVETSHEQALSQTKVAYEETVSRLEEETQDITRSVGLPAAQFDDPVWELWNPGVEQGIPQHVRLGEFVEAGTWHQFTSPALLPFIGERNVLMKPGGASSNQAAGAIQSVLLRLLASLPPGKLRFTFIDPVGLGQNVAPFMHLADYDDALVTGKAWTEPQHIEQRLADLTEHMENVIQKYLRDQFATIEEYNAQAGELAEPYRVLVVLDFPVNFTEAAARRLVSITQSGPRCGVYTIALADTEKPLPHGFNLADMEQTATVITWYGERFVWQDEGFKDCLLELDIPPDLELFTRIVSTVGEAAKEASKVEVPFERIAPPANQWWAGDSHAGLRVPLGPAGARKVQGLDLGKGTAQHVLVAGKTGSGKSTLLHTLITNLSLMYSPDEVELYLVDFKKGVEFKAYATHQLPHARVIAIESEREFGLSVLQGLDAELKRRGDLFREAGVDHVADYRQKSGQPMPRILLLVDEFQEFFTEDDRIAQGTAALLDRVVRQGRAFGIHVLLGSQTLAGTYTLSRGTIDQMAVRIALQCSEADSRLILADDNPAGRLLSRPGEAIYNDANGLVEGNNPFQVAWLPDDERDHYLAQVGAFAQEKGYQPSEPQVIFEGNAPAEVEKNQPLQDLLIAPGWPVSSRRISAWLGDPIAIKPPTAAHFRRQSGSNLLIVGQKDRLAIGMLSTTLISLAAQHEPGSARFYLLDFSPVDAPYGDVFPRLVDLIPHSIQRGRRRQLSGIISEIAAEVDRRLEEDEAALWDKPAIYLIIYGLQRARDLRPDDDLGFSYSMPDEGPAPPSPAKQFSVILQEGPDVGIHTLLWCDTYTNLTRTLERRALREFEMRIVFQMGTEDSANLIDTPAASKLGPYRALFSSEEEGRLEKFRPYALPSVSWLKWVGEQLKSKAVAQQMK